MSDTPRTDAKLEELFSKWGGDEYDDDHLIEDLTEYAEQLEREIAALRAGATAQAGTEMVDRGEAAHTLLDEYAAAVLQGFAANPAIFAPNGMSGWSLVNCTEDDLCGYAASIATKMLAKRDAIPQSQTISGNTSSSATVEGAASGVKLGMERAAKICEDSPLSSGLLFADRIRADAAQEQGEK